MLYVVCCRRSYQLVNPPHFRFIRVTIIARFCSQPPPESKTTEAVGRTTSESEVHKGATKPHVNSQASGWCCFHVHEHMHLLAWSASSVAENLSHLRIETDASPFSFTFTLRTLVPTERDASLCFQAVGNVVLASGPLTGVRSARPVHACMQVVTFVRKGRS